MYSIMLELQELEKLYDQVKDQGLKDFKKFLEFKSISSDLDHIKDVKACANWLADYLQKRGLHIDMWDTDGHPVIFATHLKAGPDKPTLLLYHHYDVQPVVPLEEWENPPFKPEIHDGQIYARGAQDNKGQCFYTILAITSILEKTGSLPVNLKILIEGEEEIGSPSLPAWLEKKRDEVKADYLAIVDVGMKNRTTPAVTLGARGIVTMDVIIDGTNSDLHSGTHGGIAFNPLHALVQVLGKLRDENGVVQVPGFYDNITELTEEEKKVVSLSFDEQDYHETFGQKPTGGERHISPGKRLGLRPTLEINGLNGGFTGMGFKTVIPARATAKLSCRLVPDQNPKKVGQSIADFIQSHAPDGIDINVHVHPGTGIALRTNVNSKIVKAFSQAYQEVFDIPAEYILEGGSIPISATLSEMCGGDTVFVGLGLADDQIHAPNEHFGVRRFKKGFLSIGRALSILSQL
ncbi:MAG: N-formyl-4-amino-5-aminomethyl-2-methylpyrimidine deformylase [Chlamydiae bacterium]|nr:N-formyl-4-amino-5-aminomethyl-2-methylpyrimidine deformylase [Chlamydiota bacterium]